MRASDCVAYSALQREKGPYSEREDRLERLDRRRVVLTFFVLFGFILSQQSQLAFATKPASYNCERDLLLLRLADRRVALASVRLRLCDYRTSHVVEPGSYTILDGTTKTHKIQQSQSELKTTAAIAVASPNFTLIIVILSQAALHDAR